MAPASLQDWIVSLFVLGLRVAPVFAFAPPFNLVPIPRLIRALFGLALAASLLFSRTAPAPLSATDPGTLLPAAVCELGMGLVIVLTFQLAFGALYLAGRTLDIQAGFGLAVLIDPATQGQVPLVGTLFAYAAAAMFFAMDGHIELLKFFAASLDAVPIGTWSMPHSIERIGAFMALASLTAFGVAGASIAVLFLIDMAIALLSRTVPQMNVLVFGFQVKTIALLLVLPLSFGLAGTLIVHLMTAMLEALPRLI